MASFLVHREPDQVATNMADITFLVTVVDKPLAALVVMLEMPANVMDGNIVEGESYEIMVSANRMVTEDTEVMIMRDRSGQRRRRRRLHSLDRRRSWPAMTRRRPS